MIHSIHQRNIVTLQPSIHTPWLTAESMLSGSEAGEDFHTSPRTSLSSDTEYGEKLRWSGASGLIGCFLVSIETYVSHSRKRSSRIPFCVRVLLQKNLWSHEERCCMETHSCQVSSTADTETPESLNTSAQPGQATAAACQTPREELKDSR